MTQTLALLIDAYRELNARKMFWVSLIISALVIASFALLGLGGDGLTILGMDAPLKPAEFWYKWLFSTVVVGLWVSVGAMILALISTASIFPDLLVSGSIDLYLSKPMSRLRLFLTKYLCGLLFAMLQATVFAVGSYLVFGLRAGQWRASMFLIIPLTTVLFSYLFAVCVLIGIMTRSTIAAILFTCLFWGLCFAASYTEQGLFVWRTAQNAEARALDRQARQVDAEIAKLKSNPTALNAFGLRESLLRRRRDNLQSQADKAAADAKDWDTAYRVVRAIATVIPKSGETINLLDARLFDDEDFAAFREQMSEGNGPFGGGGGGGGGRGRARREAREREQAAQALAAATAESRAGGATTAPTTGPSETALASDEVRREAEQRRAANLEAQEETDREARGRSVAWVLGTSIGFEVVVLSIAAWVFCRRDY